jgi:sulfur carrier protein ThiS adenylyltransferase
MHFEEIKRHLSRFRVGIAGAGGLGSNCAVALARSGVGTLVIADFDIVEVKNLNRQYYFSDQTGMLKTAAIKDNISRIDSSIQVISHAKRLDRTNIPVIFSGCDIIVEAFDRAEMKEMIVEVVQLQMPGIPLVVGSGMAGWGRNDLLKSRQVDKTLYVCGDEASESDDDLPPMAARVGIVASMQANIVIEILMNKMPDNIPLSYENKA